MGAVFISELAANSGSSWMLQALNLHFSDAVVNIHIYVRIKAYSMKMLILLYHWYCVRLCDRRLMFFFFLFLFFLFLSLSDLKTEFFNCHV